jgi:hypothetical protein
MLETNHTGAQPEKHWADLLRNAPDIPDTPAPNPTDINWFELGEYAWHYSVATGRFGDDEPELRTARTHLANIEAHLPNMNADQLRDYIHGLMTGIELFMWAGL